MNDVIMACIVAGAVVAVGIAAFTLKGSKRIGNGMPYDIPRDRNGRVIRPEPPKPMR